MLYQVIVQRIANIRECLHTKRRKVFVMIYDIIFVGCMLNICLQKGIHKQKAMSGYVAMSGLDQLGRHQACNFSKKKQKRVNIPESINTDKQCNGSRDFKLEQTSLVINTERDNIVMRYNRQYAKNTLLFNFLFAIAIAIGFCIK